MKKFKEDGLLLSADKTELWLPPSNEDVDIPGDCELMRSDEELERSARSKPPLSTFEDLRDLRVCSWAIDCTGDCYHCKH